MIIDFHTHTFPPKIAAKTLPVLGKAASLVPFTDGTEDRLLSSMAEAHVDYSVTLPVMTNPGQVEKLNTLALSHQEEGLSHGLISFGGMHPDYTEYKNELKRLAAHGIKGIKIHPAYQGVDIDDIRMMRILDAASELDFIVLIHAGKDAGIPGHNYASIPAILHVIDQVHPTKFVLGHMGGWSSWNEVERDLAGAPVWFDTAHALIPVSFHPDWAADPQYKYNLLEEDFIRLSRKHGTDRILFATDSPWQSQKEFIHALSSMALTKDEKTDILGGNALRLLKMPIS